MSLRTDDIGFGGIKLLQDPDQFCYGVDAVLLADFCHAEKTDMVAELGSGNGAASFIAWAKYRPAHITGVEVQKGPYELAVKTAEMNGLQGSISFVNSDILNLKEKLPSASFDLVITNPPYFEKGRGIVSAMNSVGIARHETTASLSDFMLEASRLLKPGGRLCMVHRPSRLADIVASGLGAGLEPKKMVPVLPKEGQNANILLIEFVKGAGRELKLMPQLILRNGDNTYTEELKAIYSSYIKDDEH